MLIFGSTAMKHWWGDYDKTPQDIDWITNLPIENYVDANGMKNEHHWCEPMSHVLRLNIDPVYVDPKFLCTIKMSHLPWVGKNGKWWKHMADLVFMQEKGCTFDPVLLALLEVEWGKRFGDKKQINLNKKPEEFFTTKVPRKYDHDQVHEFFKLGSVPAYKLISENDGTVRVSMRKFYELTPEQRLHTILEEIFVTAYERNLSFSEGYKHLITSLSKGWWNTYARAKASEILKGCKEEKEHFNEIRRSL